MLKGLDVCWSQKTVLDAVLYQLLIPPPPSIDTSSVGLEALHGTVFLYSEGAT